MGYTVFSTKAQFTFSYTTCVSKALNNKKVTGGELVNTWNSMIEYTARLPPAHQVNKVGAFFSTCLVSICLFVQIFVKNQKQIKVTALQAIAANRKEIYEAIAAGSARQVPKAAPQSAQVARLDEFYF